MHLYEVDVIARAEENAPAKNYRIPMQALTAELAVLRVTVQLTRFGMIVVDTSNVFVYDPATLGWFLVN